MAGKDFCCVGSRRKFYQGLIQQLSAAVRSRFELQALQEDGLSLEDHLRSYWRQTGICPGQLQVETIPYEIEYIWGWWIELQHTRQPAFSGHSHITYTEVRNWSLLVDITVTAFEVKCIMEIDTIFIDCHRPAPSNQSE
jgi:hypothetical protein